MKTLSTSVIRQTQALRANFFFVWSLMIWSCLTAINPVQAGSTPGLDLPPPAMGAFLNGAFPSTKPPSEKAWIAENAFKPYVSRPTVIINNPKNDRIYVGSRDGKIVSFQNDPATTSVHTFMDIRDRSTAVIDGGFLGMVFHPQFGQAGSPYEKTFYTFYTAYCPYSNSTGSVDLNNCDKSSALDKEVARTGKHYGIWLRLSRFEVIDAQSPLLKDDPGSETVMLNIRLYNTTHRGGGLVFGNDGYLYLTIGDQTNGNSAQEITQTLQGGIMRFAVDITQNGDNWSCPSGSHMPRRFIQDVTGLDDEVSGRFYCIPDDNPWLDASGGLFEEYFSIGHRNPHRLTVDKVTGRLWSGEVGGHTREEINVIEKGNNYGWPMREGLVAGPEPTMPDPLLGTLTDPVIDFTRDEANAIIGGYVYRGTKFPELYGKYIAGDHVTQNIYAITLDPDTMTATKELLTTAPPWAIGTFGEDRHGEIYFGDVSRSRPLLQLNTTEAPLPGSQPPALLSQVGAFLDDPNNPLHTHKAVPGVIPYGLNARLWTDGAFKKRWMVIPNDGSHDSVEEQIAFSEEGPWALPVGGVLIKDFELSPDPQNPSVTVPVETRFLVRGEDGYYGVTYRWYNDLSDAYLLNDGAETIIEVGPDLTEYPWTYPSTTDCLRCHTEAAGFVLGPKTRQLNGQVFYEETGRLADQLLTLDHLGIFSPSLASLGLDLSTVLTSASLSDTSATIEHRARSYLDSNCSGCHRGENSAAGRAKFDLRLQTPLADTGLINGAVFEPIVPGGELIVPGKRDLSMVYIRLSSVDPNIMMPPMAKHIVDQEAVDVVGNWIDSLDRGRNTVPELTNPNAQISTVNSIISLQVVAMDSDNDPLIYGATNLPDGLNIDTVSGVISGQITAIAGSVFNVTVSVTDQVNFPVSRSFTWQVKSAQDYSSWDGTTVPANPSVNDASAVELGVKFKSSEDGYISSIRFYKGAGNTGTHIGNLWTSDGTLLASATFTNESGSGWQQVDFDAPVPVSKDTIYIASYFAPNGNYAADSWFFGSGNSVSNGPLTFPNGTSSSGNGVFKYSANSAFPASSWKFTNYWVDVVFNATTSSSPTPSTGTSAWTDTDAPENPSANDPGAVELGVKFKSSSDGYISAIRFYKGAGNNGTHIGNLWTSDGTLLASATFTNESGSGWQQVDFDAPVAISKDTVYIASYFAPNGNYAADKWTFGKAGISNGPLTLMRGGGGNDGNGVFKYSSISAFPASSWKFTNYWVDVVFDATTSSPPIPSTGTSTWTDANVPANPSANDPGAVELGVKFKSSSDGYISAIRFYKGAGNTGTHIGNLWTSDGTLLASATFTNESGSGWQQVDFDAPVPVSKDTIYIASYFAPNGNYAADTWFFGSGNSVSNGPLTFPNGTSSSVNGVFKYSANSTFPTSSWQFSNYWVDVVFIN
jgi:uncharacterized repeat protein (TIGR03806 family)